MVNKWSDVVKDPKYQGASDSQKQAIADGFFNDVIKPNIPSGHDVEQIKTDFMASAIPAKPSVMERISAGLSDIVTPRTVVNPNKPSKPSTFKQDTESVDRLLPSVSRDRIKDGQTRAVGQLVQQGYDPRGAAEKALEVDSARIENLNKQATKPVDLSYAGPMREKPQRSLGDYFKDTAGSLVKIPGAVVRDVANIGNLVTGDSMPTDVAGTMQRGMDEFDRRYGSDARQFENQEFSRIAKDPDQDFTSQVDYLLENPTFLADHGITTIGSMFLPAGASAGAMKVLTKLTGGKVPPGIANALRSSTISGTVAMQNAAETFNDPDMKDVPLDVRYEAAGITALGTLLGNKIFGGGVERAIANKFNKSGAAQGFALAGKEGGQEAFESLSQSGGKAFALPGQVSLNQAVSGALMEGTMGAVMGGGAAVAMGGNGAVEQPTNTPVQPMTKGQKIIDFLKRQKGIESDNTATQEQAATPQTQQQSAQPPARPTEAINASDILEGENDSIPNAEQSAEVATQASQERLDNTQGSIGDQLSTSELNGTGSSNAATSGNSINNDIRAGVDGESGSTSLDQSPTNPMQMDASPVDKKANEAATSSQNDLAEPTDAQKEAGNYKVGRIKVGGLNISVENPDQSKRKGVDRDGNAWESTMNGHYGYVRGDGVKARAPDKEHIDVNVKSGTAEDYAGDVFVINQNDPKTGKFDEPKVYIGYGNEQEAEQAYRSNYAQDWQGFGDMVRMPMAKFKEMLGNEKEFLKPVKAAKPPKARKAAKANTLLTAIDSLGGIDNKYKWDISGEQKFARGGYNKIFRNASTKTLEQHIENGDLDEFLPYEMRSTATNDATAGRNYLADRIRNGDRVLPYDVELEAKQSKYFENADIQSDIDTLIEELDLDQINSLLQEAGYEERESAAEATDYESQAGNRASENTESQSPAGSIAGDQGREARAIAAKNENTGTSGSKSQERPGVREIVTAIIKRRSAANQIGKDKAFDEYLAAAKEFLNGKDIKPARFKLASATFKNDQPLSDAYAQLAELAKAPAQEALANTSSNIDQFIQRIDQATTADQLRDIARDVQKSGLTDAQIEKLDDLAMGKLDALDSQSDSGDLLGDDTAKKQAVADAERAKDAKRNTGESDSSDFVLTGSNSEADKAAAHGAQDLFSQPETTKQSKSESKPANPKTTEKTAGTSLEQVTAMRDALLRLIDAKEGINFLNSGKTYLPPDRLAYEQSQASSELAAAEKQMQEAYGKDEAAPFLSMTVQELNDLYDRVAGNPLEEKVSTPKVAQAADYIASESDLDATRIDNGYKHRVLSSTSGIIKIERQDYVNAVNSLYNDLLPIAKNDAQKEALKELTAEFKQEYIKRRYRVMDIGSTVVSSAVAGRSKFNSKQSSSRGNALDRAESDFSDWLKAQPAKIKAKINALKSDAELAEEKAKADEKAAKNKESLMKIMRNIDQFKPGDAVKFGSYNIARVSFDRDGYPSSVTVNATDLTDNKFELARTLFGGSKEKLRAIVDELRAENVSKPTQESAAVEEVTQTETTPLTLFDNAMEAYRNGTATVEEYKAAFDYVLNNEQAITDYLESNFTKQQLFDRGVSERYKSEKKDRVVSAAYSDMVRDFLLPNENGIVMSQYGFGGDKYADIKRQVAEITQESLNAAMQRRQDAIKENAERRAERIKGMADPKTLEDYQALMREKTAEGMTFQDARMTLTPAQREQYDDLVASYNREQRRGAKNAQKTQVQAAVTTTSGDIVETKHTKTGEPLFVVKAAERVERETYNQWNATAKRMGGYYSSFRGNGAVPGFQFKTRENAEAFLKYLGGDVDQAKEAIQAKRDAYADDRSQTAVERLNEMADRLASDADEELTRDRKVNTARRAGMAARAEARASENKAMAVTMRNIAAAIESGKAKYLDAVRQKVQVELLQSSVSSAQQKRLREMYPSYADYEKHRYDPPTAESADYAEFPTYTLNRSDWARLGRAMVNVDGLKAIGTKILSLADDVTDAYLKFAKENIGKVSNFSRADGQRAVFKSKADAELAIAKNGFNGKAIVLPYKRGENIIIDSPAAAKEKGVWPGDDDKRISMNSDFGKEVVEKIGRANRRANKLDMPWQLEAVYDKRQKLARMDIETPAEYRAALREFIGLKETAAAPDKVKELERSMVGRRNDGLDFFPTPAEVADTMIDVADIQDGMNVLEPSAGMGHIAERIRAAGFDPDVVEFNGDRRELLELKGLRVIGSDFLEIKQRGFGYGDTFRAPDGKEGVLRGLGGMGSQRVRLVNDAGEAIGYYNRDELEPVRRNGSNSGYDRIIMNPPFSNRRDEQHVRHAYYLLKPGGRIVAIMGEGVFIGSDKRATEFRDWLESVGGTSEKLPDGTFNDASLPVNTSANARMVVINKSDYDDTPVFSRKDDSAPAFYSQLSRAVDQAKFESSPGKQWKLWLLGNASKLGVKKDEIQWTGITDWLELQTGKVSKSDIQAYLDSNGVQVTETMLGEGGMPRLPDGWEVERQPNGEYYLLDQDGEVISEGETEREAVENGMDMDELADNPDAAGDTKYSKYVVPGGENYKELLLTLPFKSNAPTYEQWKDHQLFLDENNDVSRKKYDEVIGFYNERGTYAKDPIFKSSHWSQPNILAHVRFDERTDADGKRVLFLNEIQSDWGQEGKKEGFKGTTQKDAKAYFGISDADWDKASEQDREAYRLEMIEYKGRDQGVPAAPFVTDTKAWVSLAIKRMLRYAVDNGFDKVAFINGQQAADLYDLSKQVSGISYAKQDDGTYEIGFIDKSGTASIAASAAKEDEIEGIVGKDIARKIINGDGESGKGRVKRLSGLDLKVGGEGMRAFYDQIVPQVANDVLKKLGGGRIEETTFFAPIERRGEDFDARAITITPEMAAAIYSGQPLFKRDSVFDAISKIADQNKQIVANIQGYVDQIASGWKNAPQIIVVHDMSDTRIPERIRMENERQIGQGASGQPSAFYYQGKAYILASQMESLEEVATALFHEVLGHYGLRGLYGSDIGKVLDLVAVGYKSKVEQKAKKYGLDMAIQSDKRLAAEEVLAELAQTKPELGLVKRAIAAIRTWLRENVAYYKDLALTDNEIINNFILPARRFVERGGKELSAKGLVAAFVRKSDDTPVFMRTSQMPLHEDWENLNESGMLTDLKYKFQDKHADLKAVIKAIKATGREISDRFNPYLQEELYHGRVAKRVQDFTKKELEPLLQAMNESGVSMADFEHFLWARHAEERNAQIAKINPDMPDGGSGLTNKEAADFLAQIPAKQMATFKKLAEQVDAINAKSRNLLVEYGLEDMDTAAKMEEAYKHYVPLMRDEMEKGHGSGTGQGFSIKGNSTKRAMGSNKAVVDIIANIAAQREKFIVRGEKNRVATALVGLAKMNPNDDFWKVDKPPVIRYISSVTGLVEEMTDPNYKSRNNVVVARILDRSGRVQERAVVFNEYDERALRMAESLKNLDVDGMEEWIGTLAKGTRYFASVNTQYNPLFGVVNITRDIQAGALNLESTKLAGMQKEVIGQTYNAWIGIYKDLRNTRKGKKTAGHWSELWEEYQNEGGQTGYRELFRTAKDRTDELNKIVDPDWWKKKGWGKVVSLNSEVIANAEALAAEKIGKPIFQWLDDYNASLENSVRLAAYKAGLDKGLSKQEAASIAKNLTVNFNRKGAAGARMGAFYAFFNASVQGTARIGETMFKDGKLSGIGKKILTGGILLGVIQALALAGFDDEEPPQFERDRNLIIPVGGNKYVKIPMPLGFHVIPATARILTEYALNSGDDTAKMIAHLGEVFADAFNPVGGSSSLAQIVSPTIFDPVVDLTINEDFAGRQIAQKDFNSLDPTPGFTRARDTASSVSTVLAHVLNNMTGGTDYQPGVFSPTPDQIDYLTGQIFGGVGREILKIDSFARSMADGTDLPTYKIPLVGKFYGDAASKSSEGRKFYANIERMNGHENEIKGRNADGKPVQPYLDANPDARLWRQSKFIYSTVKKMQKRRDALLKSGAPADEIQEIDTRITQRMKALNDMVDSAKK